MGILARFKDIMAANINAMLDKMEDPEKMIDQYIRNCTEDLDKVKAETASVMADEKRAKRELDECDAEIAKLQSFAEKAVAAGNDDDARAFLSQKQQMTTKREALQQTYNLAADNATKMRQMHDKLISDISELQSRSETIKAKMKVARAQQTVSEIGATVDRTQSSLTEFGKMEVKANKMLDEANAMAELNSSSAGESVEVLEAKYKVSAPEVDDELAALKAKLGK